METIFIQIAAYRDRELVPTVQDAIAQATHPDRLSFGICWQYESEEELHYIDELKIPKNCRIEAIPAAQSRGLGWARSQTEKLWRGERYTLQIDAHMRFAVGWDTLLIDMLAMSPSNKPILTAYPPAYEPPRNLLTNIPTRLVPAKFSKSGVLRLAAMGDLSQCSSPEPGAFVAGGFMFADASIIREVPHDPNIYFCCTEVLFSARAWTRGWDIYHPHRPACWHYYNSAKGEARPLHWKDHQNWGELNRVSEQRFRQILRMEPSSQKFGIYGLGTTRTLTEYEAIAGVSFQKWKQHLEAKKVETEELLLCCARTHMDAATAERIKTLLQKDIDWDYLLQTAFRHEVMPLLYWTLDRYCPESVPKPILNQLRQHFHANSLRNISRTKELLKLLGLLKAEEITAIPFKGPALAVLAYSNLALRQSGGLDILVRKQDVVRAKQLFISQGYQPKKVQLTCEQHFIRHDGLVNLDLHWGIPQDDLVYNQLDPSLGWDRVEWVYFNDTTILNFPPEESLLLLCVDATKIGSGKTLKKICDIAALIRNYQQFNWNQVLEQSQKMRCERMLLTGLLLANEILETDLPEAIWQRINTVPMVRAMTAQWREQLFQQNVESPN